MTTAPPAANPSHRTPVAGADPVAWLADVAARDPQRPLMETESGQCITYGEMHAWCERLAGSLAGAGLRMGERLMVQAEKSPAYIALYFACLRAGAVFVPLNTAYPAVELDYFLGDAQPRILVVDPSRRDETERLSNRRLVGQLLTLDATGGGSLAELPASAEALPPCVADAGRLAALIYTSGTTGRSKGAMLSCGNLGSNALALIALWRFRADDVLLHALPVFHVHGLFVGIHCVLAAGASMIFLRKFDVQEVMQVLPRATVLMGVPTFYTRLLQHPGLSVHSTEHMRLFISGSAPLLEDTFHGFQRRTGHEVLERYGMSETLMNTSMPYDGPRVPGSVGRPLPGVEVRITEPETGEPLATSSIGMIEVRGPNVFRGYWQNPEKTAADVRANGFFITGDLGRFDARGYLTIVGRAKDLVITGGYNVYPVEVEAEIDAIAGVRESAVIGLPHADFGEAVTALVVLHAADTAIEERVLALLAERLAKFKIPKRVLVIEELPRNAMGKVQKAALRKTYEDLYAR